MKANLFIIVVLSVFLPSSIFADEREGEVVQRPIDEAYEEGWTKVKQFTDDEVKEACRKYNNKLIGYYDELYKVVNCERRQVTRGKSLMQRSENVKVHIVAAEIVAKIPLGAPLDSQEASHKRSCKQLEGRYVTYTFTNIFIVKGCKLRLFPDWETFQAHRKKNNTMKNEIISLTENEFFAMRRSEPIASEIDKVFGSVLSGAAGVDVIPIDEACEGVEGKDVFYYSKIYRIQNCRKREYDPEQYVKSKKGNVNLKELSSSQWLSLPEGKPMFKKKLKGEG